MTHELVIVEWIDSHSGNGWRRLEEVEANSTLLRCKSVGWLAAESRECLTLVASISGEDQDIIPFATGDICIPRRAIVSTRVLNASGRPRRPRGMRQGR